MPSARRAAMKARTSAGVSLASWRRDGGAAQMGGEKAEKLRDVARVGLQGLSRHAPLGAEIAQPAGDFGWHIGGGNVRSWRHKVARASFTLP